MAYIKTIKFDLPEQILTNEELQKEKPDWEMDRVVSKSGVHQRHIASKDETALTLALRACDKLFEQEESLKDKVDGLIVCTQTPDYQIPPNSALLQSSLGLRSDLFSFDINHACSGYIYAIALAKSLIESGQLKDVLVVTCDTYSKYIHEDDRSARVLFGDGAAVSYVSSEAPGLRIDQVFTGTDGGGFDQFYIPAGGAKKQSQIEELSEKECFISMNGMGILSFVSGKVAKHLKQVLKETETSADSYKWIVFHQASEVAMKTLARLARIPESKMIFDVKDKGNTVSSSIPIAMAPFFDQFHEFEDEEKLLLCGFGSGLSWGSAILTNKKSNK